ncbi:MAG: ATP-dependent zinc protease [Desulfobacteraceae bacterium]|nr:ATP-dependent zinc protease [Desulfobacteraceae bacterium]MCB9494790.1 ATP-dependent zinc protease [Desulfobacteraceae bacterium]
MTQTISFTNKAISAAIIFFFISGCATGDLFTHKKEFTELNQKILNLQGLLDQECKNTKSLVELNQKTYSMIQKSIEQNNAYFKLLDEQILHNHKTILKRLKNLEKLSRNNHQLESFHQNLTQKNDPEKPELKISPTHKLMIGKIEKVRLTPPDSVFHARIDTGATTSSLDAKNIETFERDGSSWVRFKIKDPSEEKFYDVEKPVVRKVKILQASNEEASRRPVIELQFQIGDIKRIEEFTLEDRSHLEYQVLIGRNILRDLMIVDVAQEFIVPLPDENESENQTK